MSSGKLLCYAANRCKNGIQHIAHTQYSYYLVALGDILPKTRSIVVVYMDIACKIKHTWKRYIDQELVGKLDSATIEYLRSIQMHVNWLHAAGHNFECQIKNSGRYQDDAGRRVGEQIEQLWSMLKVSPCICSACGLTQLRLITCCIAKMGLQAVDFANACKLLS
jgi:hypothetical protein